MNIAMVQSLAEKGAVAKNIDNHLKLIHSATQLNASLIVFPELSITGYGLELAEALAFELNDRRFDVFQEVADTKEVTIGVGAPTRSSTGIHISMILFQPHIERRSYTKQMLHQDELPYYVGAVSQPVFNIKGKKIAFGICYETLQLMHMRQAVDHQADLYLASVAKPLRGIKKANAHFPAMASTFHLPILMSNCIGYCDNFWSGGQSAIWDKNGALVLQLNGHHEGILLYDTEHEEAKAFYIKNRN